MPIAQGTRLGPYEILAPLGAGGMGEVYRARDTRLGREVAVKVLPSHLTSSEELRTRFEREARTVSSLNHPNICTLHDVGRENGTDYLVMELVEGESLADRVERGAMPLAEVVRIGGQIADALERAHRAGILHRDLKPGNVMLAKTGAKLMDFGLSRPVATADPGLTSAQPLTSHGTIVGTYQYMAPELLEGREADVRSDIWALGCVLYEMATGRPAYGGSSPASLISAILREEPRSMNELAPMAPASLDAIVRGCLAKDPEQRWQSAHDVALALRGPQGSVGAAVEERHEPTYRQLTFGRGCIIGARFAPDGRTVVYDAAWEGDEHRLYLTRTDSPETTMLPLPPAVLHAVSSRSDLAISLDRHFLGSWWLATGMLAQAPLFGGSPREIAPDVYDAAFLPGTDTLAVTRRVGHENVVEFPIGNPVFRSPWWIIALSVSPDGTYIAFVDMATLLHGAILRVFDRNGREVVQVPFRFWNGGIAWRPDGKAIVTVDSKSADGARLRETDLSGNSRPLTRFLGGYVTVHDIAPSGDVLMSRQTHTYTITSTRPGQPDANLGQFDFPIGKSLSEDGTTLLYDEQGLANEGELYTYVRATDGSPPVRLGPGYARDLSPDGKWAINIHQMKVRLLPRGAGVPREVDLGPIGSTHLINWHPDGQRLVVMGSEKGRPMRIWVVPVAGGTPRAITPEGVSYSSGAIVKMVSNDGTRVAALTPDGVLKVHAIEDGAEVGSWPLEDGEEPVRWCAGDGAVFLWRRGDVPIRVTRLDLATGERTPWREYPPGDRVGVVCSRSLLMTADGEICVHTYSHMISELYAARGLL